MHYLTDRFHRSERRLIVLAALLLIPVLFLPVLPIWQMKLWAPQYREGLTLTIFTNTIRGNLQSINLLNHYVGMHAIRPDEFAEFHFLPQALTGLGFVALLAFLVNRRWVAILGWLLFTGFAAAMFADFATWLYHFGHDLDPRAPIKLPAFTPPLIGYHQMANFRVLSLPGSGTLLLGAAWLLGPLAIFLEMRDARAATRRATTAPAPAVASASAPGS